MNLIPLSFMLSGFLALPAFAAGTPPAPALVHLDQVLTQAIQDKHQGKLASERVAEFATKFRVDFAAAEAGAPPTPENMSIEAHIVARLNELDPATVGSPSIPRVADTKSALSRAHFDEKTTPTVSAEEKRILSSEPFTGNRRDLDGVAPSGRTTRKIHFAPMNPESLPAILPVKFSPTAAPPGLTDEQTPHPSTPFPLVPLAVAAGLGAAAYGVSQSRSAYASTEGLDDEHPTVYGEYQKLVANTILAGAAGGAIFLAGSAAITTAAPILVRYAPPIIEQGVRLAGSEAGAINPTAVTEAPPEAEAGAVEVEQIVIKKGDFLNRVWHSAWEENSAMSGPKGQSYCRGHWLPIHAASAIQRRGLVIDGVFNNAQKGSVFVATEDITAIVRKSIGGVEEEILIPLSDASKLVEISRSDIHPGIR